MFVFKQTKGAHPSTQSHVFFSAHDGSELFDPPIYVKEDESKIWKHLKFT